MICICSAVSVPVSDTLCLLRSVNIWLGKSHIPLVWCLIFLLSVHKYP